MEDKPHDLLSTVKYATIVKHGREVGGGFGLVHDIFWREEKPWVVLKLPTGRRLTIPAAWTDLPSTVFSTMEERRELYAPTLLELAKFCRHLRQQSRRRTTNRTPKIQTRK